MQTHNTTAAANAANVAAAAAAAAAPAPVAARRLSGRGREEGSRRPLRARRSPRLLRAAREAAMSESAVAAPAPVAPSHCALRLTVLNQTSSEALTLTLTLPTDH